MKIPATTGIKIFNKLKIMKNKGISHEELKTNLINFQESAIFIGSNITRNNIDGVLVLNPAGITLSKAITQAEDPLAEILYFVEKIKEHKK